MSDNSRSRPRRITLGARGREDYRHPRPSYSSNLIDSKGLSPRSRAKQGHAGGGFIRGEKPVVLSRSDLNESSSPKRSFFLADSRDTSRRRGSSIDATPSSSSHVESDALLSNVSERMGARSDAPEDSSSPKWSSASEIMAKLRLVQDSSPSLTPSNAEDADRSVRPRRFNMMRDASPTEMAAERVRLTLQSRSEVASLDNIGLNRWPKELVSMGHLLEINLESNRLQSIPPEISIHERLVTLQLYGNELSTLPPEIGALTNLTGLFLSNNVLQTLPSSIGQLSHLTWLSLDCNNLESLPDELSNLRSLSWLSVEHNRLSTIPAVVGSLTSLSFFSICHNEAIHVVPPGLTKLNNLMDFRYSQSFQLPKSVVAEKSGGGPDAIAVYLQGLNKLGVVLDGAASRTHWLDDSSVTECKTCSTSFSLTLKKHHCRMCGGIFCKRCASLRTVVPQLHYTTPTRVCDKCYRLLTGREIIHA